MRESVCDMEDVALRVLLVVAVASGVAACSPARKPEPVTEHIFSGDAANFETPVAIANVGGSDYVLANYDDVALFDKSTGSVNRLSADNPEFVREFVPTSFAVDAVRGKLLIANYRANNVIVASLDKTNRKLHFDRLIGDERTVSPEGVAVSGDLVAVANYGGDNVQFFDQGKSISAAVCTVSVRQAHGVVFLGGFAYATSLEDRRLVKIDPGACAISAGTGESGWKPKQFLWPTQVAVWDNESIAVTDAHTGLISVYGARTLDFIKSFGGNGPGRNELNMPYGLAVGGSDLFVTSTFGNRIVRFDKATGLPLESWSQTPVWEALADGSPFTLIDEGRSGYIDTHTSIAVDGACFHPGYAGLESCDGGKNIALPPIDDINMYFIQVAQQGGQTLVFSPQCPIALLVGAGGWATRSVIYIGIDHWLIDGQAVGPDGAAFEIGAAAIAASEP
jgi:DNA-binding beta-propeller fold protein YncE